MPHTRKTAARTKATKAMPRPGAINPIEHNITNEEDLAVAGLRQDEARKERMRRRDHGKPGTFSPKSNDHYQ